MSNVLVLGVGPLPVEKAEKVHAPGIRTWAIASALAARKHNVLIGLIQFGDFQSSTGNKYMTSPEPVGDNVNLCRLKYHIDETPRALAALHLGCRFHCVVSTTDIMNSVAAAIPIRVPLWFDLLGDPFSERQLQAAVYDNDASLIDQWKLMLAALLRGDRFSVASTPQKYTLIGQLGFAGRLNQFTSGLEMIHVLENCSRIMMEKDARMPTLLKGRRLPDKCFMVLWSGGYNTWCDPVTLFKGLEIAMSRDSEIHFVSAGGELTGHDNVTFNRFRELVEKSEYAPRFHFLGWVPTDQMPAYYRQADAAINVDAWSYEAEIGTRTRIMDWIQFDVPVVTTALCEPARVLERSGLIETFLPGNPESMAIAILQIKAHPEIVRERVEQARQFFNLQYEETASFKPLLDWAEQPEFAPDRLSSNGDGARQQPNVDCSLAEFHRRWSGQIAAPKGAPAPPVGGTARDFKSLLRKIFKYN